MRFFHETMEKSYLVLIFRYSHGILYVSKHREENMKNNNVCKFPLSNIANANQNVTIENIAVTAPIQVVQKLDESDIKEHSRTIGELSSRYIRESLSRKGIVPAISSI